MNIQVTSSKTDESAGTLRYALKQSSGQKVIITFSPSVTEIDFSGIRVASEASRELRYLQLDSTCKGVNIIGPVTIIGAQFYLSKVTSDINLDSLRFRVGSKNLEKLMTLDSFYAEKCSNINIVNCSFSHSIDETISLDQCETVNFDRCIFGPPLHDPTVDNLGVDYIHSDGKLGSHGYLLRNGASETVSITRCLFTDASKRAPQLDNEGVVKRGNYEFFVQNCVVYNYDIATTFNLDPKDDVKGSTMEFDVRNNLFVPGPRTAKGTPLHISKEFDLESPKNMKLNLLNVDTNKIAWYPTFTVGKNGKYSEVPSGKGPSIDITLLLSEQVGCRPLDAVDTDTIKRVRHHIDFKAEYDNLDVETVWKRWGSSGWPS